MAETAEVIDQLARAEVRTIRKEVSSVTETLEQLVSVVTEMRAEMRAKQPMGLMDLIKGAIVLGAFVGLLVGGVGTVVAWLQSGQWAQQDGRMKLIEHRLHQIEQPPASRYVRVPEQALTQFKGGLYANR